MVDSKLTPWNEKTLNDVEEMKVVEPIRLRNAKTGKAEVKKIGEKVDLSGDEKKSLYFRLKVCYPKDYDHVIKSKADKRDITPAVYEASDKPAKDVKKK